MEEFTIFISRIFFHLSWQLSHQLSCLSRIGTMLRVFRDILHIVFRMRVRCTANTRHRPSGSLMFDQLLRRWPNIKPATSTGSRVVFAGDTCSMISSRLGAQQSKGEEHKPGGVNQTYRQPLQQLRQSAFFVIAHSFFIVWFIDDIHHRRAQIPKDWTPKQVISGQLYV